nr:MAG TPA: hypothetical protein [Caudoviricetes sp.]
MRTQRGDWYNDNDLPGRRARQVMRLPLPARPTVRRTGAKHPRKRRKLYALHFFAGGSDFV